MIVRVVYLPDPSFSLTSYVPLSQRNHKQSHKIWNVAWRNDWLPKRSIVLLTYMRTHVSAPVHRDLLGHDRWQKRFLLHFCFRLWEDIHHVGDRQGARHLRTNTKRPVPRHWGDQWWHAVQRLYVLSGGSEELTSPSLLVSTTNNTTQRLLSLQWDKCFLYIVFFAF